LRIIARLRTQFGESTFFGIEKDKGLVPGVNYKSLQRQLEFPTRWQA